ncbi:MAG: beta-glucosidase, partial [Anaerolinea sp.]|nr:beta-glucosidase [Anaerolinea sp.]
RLREQGLYTARSGIRWHLIEPRPHHYDFSSVIPMLRAARSSDMQIIWDLMHYGYPDDLDPFKPEFVSRFTGMVRAFAQVYREETDQPAFFCPVNEISFFSWGGGDVGYLNPFATGRGFELKVQLARMAIHAIEAIWDVLPSARIVHVDPVIHIAHHPERPEDQATAEGHRVAQFQGWDLISGQMWEQIGGHPRYLDIIGLNYYSNNQWFHGGGGIIEQGSPHFRPFRDIAREVFTRYGRPMFIAETGAEDDMRPLWLRYMAGEARALIAEGIPLGGLCLYPILNHPGWDDDRHCHNGMWDYCDTDGEREICQPYADELRRQQALTEPYLVSNSASQAPA